MQEVRPSLTSKPLKLTRLYRRVPAYESSLTRFPTNPRGRRKSQVIRATCAERIQYRQARSYGLSCQIRLICGMLSRRTANIKRSEIWGMPRTARSQSKIRQPPFFLKILQLSAQTASYRAKTRSGVQLPDTGMSAEADRVT